MQMTTVKIILLMILFLSAVAGMISSNSGEPLKGIVTMIRLFPADLKWKSNPTLHGLETAILFGNPDAPELYIQRIKIPAGTRLVPHSHPNSMRMVTVLSGTLYFAFGEKFDESKLTALPPGTFFTEPKDLPHYSMAKEDVILQFNASGPAGTNYIKAGNERKD
jgi:quercetin dioxygenase-like cupin family protein